MADLMRERGVVVSSAAQMLSHGQVNLEVFPGLIERIIDEEMWRQRAIPQKEWRMSLEFNSFVEFVKAKPLDGLGTTVKTLENLCRDRLEILEKIRDASVPTVGTNQYSEGSDNITTREGGTSRADTLRRLRKDRPDLHARVLAGELSAHAAAIEAGFRHRTLTVPIDDPDRLAVTLLRRLDYVAIQRVIELLEEGIE